MPRRRVIAKREIIPDPIYNSVLIAKFINVMMWDGKRAVAERILYSALDAVKAKTSEEPLKIFKKAVENLQPRVEVKSKRVGG
ncbi:MAG: 30S ribosomal protein S7, partial [Blastocatellia bacterium]